MNTVGTVRTEIPPRGDNLARALLFNSTLADTDNLPFHPDTYRSWYADDAQFVVDLSTDEGEEILRRDCQTYADGIRALGLQINVSKSRLLVINFGKKQAELSTPLIIDGVVVLYEGDVTILR